MNRLLSICLIVLTLSGCATFKIKPEKLSAIRNIGVVSILGNELCIDYVGTTVFTIKRNSFDAVKWGIDNYIRDVIGQAIRADGRFQYINHEIDSMSMHKVYGPKKAGCTKTNSNIDLIKNEIQGMKDKYDIDTLILVLEYWGMADYITGRTEMLFNYGVHQSRFIGITETVSHVFAHIYVIDTFSSEIMSNNYLNIHEKIDNMYFDLDLNTLSKEKKEFIENSIKNQLQKKLIERLKKIELIR